MNFSRLTTFSDLDKDKVKKKFSTISCIRWKIILLNQIWISYYVYNMLFVLSKVSFQFLFKTNIYWRYNMKNMIKKHENQNYFMKISSGYLSFITMCYLVSFSIIIIIIISWGRGRREKKFLNELWILPELWKPRACLCNHIRSYYFLFTV